MTGRQAGVEDVPPGYKRTNVGVIPEDWEVLTIAQLIKSTSILGHLDGNHGEQYPRSSEFKQYGVPYIGASDFINGRVSFERCKFLSEEKAARFRKGVAKDGDVLFAHNATVGPVALLRTNENFIILSTTATFFRCNCQKLDNVYLAYALQSPHFVLQYQTIMAQSTRFQVPITAQRGLSLVVPPHLEQRALAAALSDVDGLIGALDALIEKKRAIKQAAMQQLLTGKTRLPGFTGEWRDTTVGEIADIRSGATPSTQILAYWNGQIPWCTPTDITGTLGKYLLATERNITVEGLENCAASLLPVGALLLCSRATIGEIKIATSPVCTNQGFKSLICKSGISNEFLYYLLLTLKPQMIERAIGSTFLEIGKRDVASIKLRIPEHSEQTAIAALLSDMDAEIAALERRREKAKQIKQGMMQQLLTGRIRLVDPPEAGTAA